jgi:hypothetical protein
MREFCTYGSVGAPGEQSPGATRPSSLVELLFPVELPSAVEVADVEELRFGYLPV